MRLLLLDTTPFPNPNANPDGSFALPSSPLPPTARTHRHTTHKTTWGWLAPAGLPLLPLACAVLCCAMLHTPTSACSAHAQCTCWHQPHIHSRQTGGIQDPPFFFSILLYGCPFSAYHFSTAGQAQPGAPAFFASVVVVSLHFAQRPLACPACRWPAAAGLLGCPRLPPSLSFRFSILHNVVTCPALLLVAIPVPVWPGLPHNPPFLVVLLVSLPFHAILPLKAFCCMWLSS